jgi:predicted ATPase/class 3 adenylate cyclase
MAAQPMGTVTMLFTDVEASTQLLERLGVERYADVLEQHNRLLREAFARHSGYEVDTAGDSFFVTFSRAADAASAAGEAQRSLASTAWPDGARVRVRMAIHTGEPLVVDSRYVGMDVHRAARIMASAHGGQVLVSETTAPLLEGVRLRDLGPHRLKDLLAPIRLHQLVLDDLSDEFPPPRSLYRTNLPTAAWPLVGREREVRQIRALVSDDIRLVTLTGPGGVGKTRLALQAAAELADEFPDGVYFVPLAPLRDASVVSATIAETVGLQPDEDLAAALRSKRLLLVLDNLEHLERISSSVAEVLVGETTVIATSRHPLRLSGEREFVVDSLADDAAIELFVSRAAASGREVVPDETVAAVCRRLDNLPLALELAAARVKLLSPSALMQRLESALPLLTGGGADRPERQQTLRATIDWSHALLDPEARVAFRRLSVFRGSFALGIAEAITGASLDEIGALVDHSLLKPVGEERLFQLETIREYAREQLAEAGEDTEVALRHARHYLAQLRERDRHVLGSQRGALLSWFEDEEDNLRAALDRLELHAPAEAAEMATLLAAYWLPRNQLVEARQRFNRISAVASLSAEVRAPLLSALADCETRAGDQDAALAVATEALGLAEEADDRKTIGATLYTLALIAVDRGQLQQAEDTLTRALERGADDVWTEALLHSGRASVGVSAGRDDEARVDFRAARAGFRAAGDEANEASCAIQLAELEVYVGDFEAAVATVGPALEWARATGDRYRQGGAATVLGLAEVGIGRRGEAMAAFKEGLELVLASERTGSQIFAALVSGIAFASAPEIADSATRLLGAAAHLHEEAGFVATRRESELKHRFGQFLIDALGPDEWAVAHTAGGRQSLDETIALAVALADGTAGTFG